MEDKQPARNSAAVCFTLPPEKLYFFDADGQRIPLTELSS